MVALYRAGRRIEAIQAFGDVRHFLAERHGLEPGASLWRVLDLMLSDDPALMGPGALVVKVRDGHQVRNKAAHIAVGVDLDGIKHVLGIWVQATEGAKFWAGVCAELRNRGVRDVLIVCCDWLTGFPEAVEATWPAAMVQTCTVHLIRASMRFVAYGDRRAVAAALKPVYTVPTVEAAETGLLAFADSPLGRKYPATVQAWERAWERFIPFLAFPPEVRKIIYTTNAIESLNYQLRKIIKNRGHFPGDDAVIKLLWLAIRDIEDKRARERAAEKGTPAAPAKPLPGSSKAPSSRTGNKPSAPCPCTSRPPRPVPQLTPAAISTVARASHTPSVEEVSAEPSRRMDLIPRWAFGDQGAAQAERYLRRLAVTEPVTFTLQLLIAADTEARSQRIRSLAAAPRSCRPQSTTAPSRVMLEIGRGQLEDPSRRPQEPDRREAPTPRR
jgi:hypothetical protein